jgi:diguanylate cyclase (GGDEF)-like protein/PAS domain S-box-containing protein
VVDKKGVSENAVAHETLDAALSAVLTSHSQAIVAALSDDGHRIALPAAFELGAHHALPVPAERETMLHVVVPADRMAVLALWERALRVGVGVGAVRVLSDPDHRVSLSIIDARHRYGVWLATLTGDAEAGESTTELLAGPLVIPSRPRLATAHKSMFAIITATDANVSKMLGWTAEQMIGERSTAFIHPDDHDRAVSSWMELVAAGGSQRIRLRHRCQDGSWLWVEVEHVHNGAENFEDVDVLAYISDISDEMAAHEALHRREQLFSRLAESLPSGVLQLHQDRSVAYANARLTTILEIAEPTTAADVLANLVDRDRPAVDAALNAALDHGEDHELEVEVLRPRTADRRRCALTFAAVCDTEGRPGALICVSDVTESARMRDELKFQATYDALTGCLNRASVTRALEQFLAQPGESATAVIFVDVDKFKPINDRLGHAAGDELLVHLAGRLKALTRGDDVVGRLGGDEFLLVCRDLDLPRQALAIAARVRDALNQPATLAAGTVELRASIGVALVTPGMTLDTLVANADTAMYESKRRGDGQPVLHDDVADAATTASDADRPFRAA